MLLIITNHYLLCKPLFLSVVQTNEMKHYNLYLTRESVPKIFNSSLHDYEFICFWVTSITMTAHWPWRAWACHLALLYKDFIKGKERVITLSNIMFSVLFWLSNSNIPKFICFIWRSILHEKHLIKFCYINWISFLVYIYLCLFCLSDIRAHEVRSPVIDAGYSDSESTEIGLCF